MIKYGRDIHFNPQKLSRHSIDRQTVELVPEGSHVLEIGCATGFMGEYLRKKKNCTVTGVELRLDEAKIAKEKLNKVVIGNIEDKETLGAITGTYDVILASALIQHLVSPQKALVEWKRLLKPNGVLVITCSNIAHWSIVNALFRGEFKYQEYGLLDNTHLRFFTPNTFRLLIEKAGYKILHYSIDAEGGGFPKVSMLLSKFFHSLFTYQMLIVAKKK